MKTGVQMEDNTEKRIPKSGEYWRCWVHIGKGHREIYCLLRGEGNWKLGRYILEDEDVEVIERVR